MESKGKLVGTWSQSWLRMECRNCEELEGQVPCRRLKTLKWQQKEFAKQMYIIYNIYIYIYIFFFFSRKNCYFPVKVRYMWFIFDGIWYENLQISFYMKFSSLPGILKDPTMWCKFQVMRGVQVPDRRGRWWVLPSNFHAVDVEWCRCCLEIGLHWDLTLAIFKGETSLKCARWRRWNLSKQLYSKSMGAPRMDLTFI